MFRITIWLNSGADNCISRKNRSNYDTSKRFGIDTLQGSPYRKKTRATQNVNMAAIFQDGRHRLSWNTIFCLKRAADGRKRLFCLHILYSKHSKCSIDVINTMQMFRFFQYGRQFQAGRHHLSYKHMAYNFALKWQQTVKEIIFLNQR